MAAVAKIFSRMDTNLARSSGMPSLDIGVGFYLGNAMSSLSTTR